MNNSNATLNAHFSATKHGQRFTPTTYPQFVYTPESIEQRKQIERLLTFYGYKFTTTIYGDIILFISNNSLEISTLTNIIAKIAGIKPKHLNVSIIPARTR